MNFLVDVNLYLPGGASVVPTDGQFKKIKEAINSIMNNGIVVDSQPEPKVKRRYTKRHTRVSWTPEEDAVVRNLKLEGYNWKQVSRELYRRFNTVRSVVAVNIRYNRLIKIKPIDPDKLVPTDAKTFPKPLEWGGLERPTNPSQI